LRAEQKVKIGTTTGFSREMVNAIKVIAEKQGYSPDVDVAGDEVENGMGFRPAPFMVLKNMERAGVSDRRTVVKVDDTLGGVGEGLNAGVWSVGVYRYSNYTDIDSLAQWKAMPEKEFEKCVEKSRQILMKSGAHYIIEDLRYLPAVVEDINARLRQGEEP
jgi:phosphonoacetaldehyde hydrolase